ncbi:hypothetical protein C8T65DRAFT_771413, partial [Cerioporus squamosus]
HAFDVLDRRGLHTTSTQGTFHHTFEEALDHTLEAHIRDLWCTAGGVDKLEDLRSRTPAELSDLATKIYDQYASHLAVADSQDTDNSVHDPEDADPTEPPSDPLLRQVIMFVRDVLDYRVLRDAIKCGDVQTMEDMLPRLVFRFQGGSNKNYAIEICELLQGLKKEWPDDLKTFITKYCWLTNTSGHQNSWIPIDRAQEHNVRDIKYTFAAMGPFASWEYIRKISASIPCQRKVKDHVEQTINNLYRGKSHTSPSKEADVAKLQAVYRDARAHVADEARKPLSDKDVFVDVVKAGSDSLLGGTSKAFKRWASKRLRRYPGVEEWDSDSETEA